MSPSLAATLVAGAYLLGSVSWSVVIVKLLQGLDVRTIGSGNAGATGSGGTGNVNPQGMGGAAAGPLLEPEVGRHPPLRRVQSQRLRPRLHVLDQENRLREVLQRR